ncbi:hypothetical protein PHYPSEUDO_010397 [Phytophthora pseudosyringae]|uniref:Pre-rRNA-processing protein RIX1 N-terminal domain-containing protein n=1 Tax=Phytophthora pseudosyringae TaxID=221518 RepID=A0A8T1VD93_9STRA|nr:hypothetical protein PHYPSEUDO_010397 [Phytophthora pseudosyringae]
MVSDSRAVETALARNLLSSVLALAFPSDLESDSAALEAFLTQQVALRDALERHNVFGLVTDGKALTKWQTRLLQLAEGSSTARRVGWELMLTTARQSPLERLESLAVKLLERVVKVLKQQQSSKAEDDDAEEASASACGVAQALLLHVDRFNPDTRREVLELLGKLLQPLVALLSRKRQTSKASLVIAQLELIAALLRASPNSLRSYAVKIESACVGALFPATDGSVDDEVVAQKATVCLALLCNASDKPQQVWTQMAQKALEAAHQQLDLLAGKRSTMLSTEGVTGKKLWVQGAASQQLPIYQRAEVTLIRMSRALSALRELLSARTATLTRGQISEREVQHVLPEVIVFARRAMGVRAHEVGKHTGVSDDGVRLPISVVYAVLPRVHAQALCALSSSVERLGICALRHASKITRVLLLASESVGDGEDLQALADTTAVCARRLGASTVEKLGVPLLNELVTRCKRSLEEKTSTASTSNNVAKALAAQQNDSKNTGTKSKKRKRQAAAAATLAALNGGTAAAGQASFVSLRDEAVAALNLDAVLTAIAGCVGVYGSLLPEVCRSSASEVALKAIQRRYVVGSRRTRGAMDPVALVLMSDAVTADASGSHAANLLRGLQYWQHRIIGSGGASSALQLIALNAGEAMLHPRGPPMAINFQQGASREEEDRRFGGNLMASKESAVLGDALDWDENEHDESDDEDVKVEQTEAQQIKEVAKPEASTVTEEEEEDEDYDDARPQSKETPMEVEQEIAEPAAKRAKDSDSDNEKKPVATVEADDDDDDDDFPDIVVDDD